MAYLRVWRLCILFPFLQLVLMQKSPVCSSLEDIFACKIEFQNTHTGPIKVWRTRLKLLFLYQRQSSELISRQYKNCCVYSLSPHWLIHFFLQIITFSSFWNIVFYFPLVSECATAATYFQERCQLLTKSYWENRAFKLKDINMRIAGWLYLLHVWSWAICQWLRNTQHPWLTEKNENELQIKHFST